MLAWLFDTDFSETPFKIPRKKPRRGGVGAYPAGAPSCLKQGHRVTPSSCSPFHPLSLSTSSLSRMHFTNCCSSSSHSALPAAPSSSPRPLGPHPQPPGPAPPLPARFHSSQLLPHSPQVAPHGCQALSRSPSPFPAVPSTFPGCRTLPVPSRRCRPQGALATPPACPPAISAALPPRPRPSSPGPASFPGASIAPARSRSLIGLTPHHSDQSR